MRVEVLGVARRRRWSDEEKLSILMEVGVGGATVTQVAHRHDLTRQQIYIWRNEVKRKDMWHPDAGLFLPVEVGEEAVTQPPAGTANDCGNSVVELCLSGDRRLRFSAAIDRAVLTGLIRAVEAA